MGILENLAGYNILFFNILQLPQVVTCQHLDKVYTPNTKQIHSIQFMLKVLFF